MNNETKPGINWSKFKLLMTLLLVSSSFCAIYMAVEPILEETNKLKNWINLLFAALLVFFDIILLTIHENHQFVFWATSFGMLIFASVMFIQYEMIFQ